MAGCEALQLPGGAQPTPSPEPTIVVALPTPLSPVAAGTAVTPTQALSTLRVWIPPEIGGRTQASAEVLSAQIQEFNSRYPELEIVVERKAIDGPGGILSYLRTGRAVTSGVLPDVIAIPGAYLADPTVRELVFPLDPFVEDTSFGDFFEASTSRVKSDSGTVGYPFAMTGLSHLVYSPQVITGTVPLRWSEFITDTANTMLLPVDSREGAFFGLQFYLAEGGSLINEAGQPDLEQEPLARALGKIAQGKATLLQSPQLKSLEEAWQLYQIGTSNHVWMRSDYLLGERALLEGNVPIGQPNRGFAAVPGPAGPLVPLLNTWLWSVTTPEAPRQALATELILFLTESQNMADWTSVSYVLPPRRDVVASFAETDPYFAFAGRELERAEAYPVAATNKLMDALGAAVFDVLVGNESPAVIAERTIADFRQ